MNTEHQNNSPNQPFYPQYGVDFIPQAINDFSTKHWHHKIIKSPKLKPIVSGLVLFSGIGSIILGVFEALRAHHLVEKRRYTRAAVLIIGGLMFCTIWYGLLTIFNSSSLPIFEQMATVSNSTKTSAYTIKIPKDFIQTTVNGIDNAKTYQYLKKGDDHMAMIRIGNTFIGKSGTNKFDETAYSLKNLKSAFFQNFASSVRSGPDYRDLRLGTFNSFTTMGVKNGLISNVALEPIYGRTMIGKLLLAYGSTDQYALLLVADKATWEQNSDFWQQTLNSFHVEK